MKENTKSIKTVEDRSVPWVAQPLTHLEISCPQDCTLKVKGKELRIEMSYGVVLKCKHGHAILVC